MLYARQWCHWPEDVVQDALPGTGQPAPATRQRGGLVVSGRAQRRDQRGSPARAAQKREQRLAVPEAWFEPVSGPLDAQEAAASLASLELELREVVVARIWGNLTFAEIAKLVGTSLSTRQRRYAQAIKQLQARLDEPCKTNDRDTTPRLGGIEAQNYRADSRRSFRSRPLMFAAGQHCHGGGDCGSAHRLLAVASVLCGGLVAALIVAPRGPLGAVSPIASDATNLRHPLDPGPRRDAPGRLAGSDLATIDGPTNVRLLRSLERGDRESFEPRSGHEASYPSTLSTNRAIPVPY